MAKPTTFDGIINISDADFWSSLHSPPGNDPAAASALAHAIALGQSGKRAAAWKALGSYLLLSVAPRWDLHRQWANDALASDAAAPGAAAPTLADVCFPERELISWRLLLPLSTRLLATQDPTLAPLVAQAITLAYRQRRQLADTQPYPFYTQLGAYGQFQMAWRALLGLVHLGAATPAVIEACLKLILGIGRSMADHSARYLVHNIFTAGNFGLFFIARSLPEFAAAAAWDALALRNFDTDWKRSYFADGGHIERNWGYGWYTLNRLTEFWNFGNVTGGLGSAQDQQRYLDALRRAYRFYALTLDPHGLSPGFGDEGLDNWGPILAKAVSSGVFPPETPHNLGVDSARSVFLAGSGVAIFRNGDHPRALFADITFGDFAGWHSHMDALSIDLRAGRDMLIQETPRFGPYRHPLDQYCRQPEAHNQLLVDGFFYDTRAITCQDIHWHSDDRVDYFSAIHRGYRQVPPQEGWRTFHAAADLLVRRTVLFVKNPGYLLVMDSVRGEGADNFNHASSQWWHGPRPFQILEAGVAQTRAAKGHGSCLLAWAQPQTLRRMEPGIDFTRGESSGQPHGDRDWFNLRVRSWNEVDHPGCVGFITLLWPQQSPVRRGRVPVRLELLPLPGAVPYRAQAIAVTTPAGRDVLVLNPEKLADVIWRGRSARRAAVELAGRRGKLLIG